MTNLWSGAVIRSYFFENTSGETVTVNDDRIWPELMNLDIEDFSFHYIPLHKWHI